MYEFFQFLQTTAVYVAGIWAILFFLWYLTRFTRSYRIKNLVLRIIFVAFLLTLAGGLLFYLLFVYEIIRVILTH